MNIQDGVCRVLHQKIKGKQEGGELTIRELSDEMRKQIARCDRYCGTWNSEDRDCEIYGIYHPSPAKCRYFLECELERRNKEIKEK